MGAGGTVQGQRRRAGLDWAQTLCVHTGGTQTQTGGTQLACGQLIQENIPPSAGSTGDLCLCPFSSSLWTQLSSQTQAVTLRGGGAESLAEPTPPLVQRIQNPNDTFLCRELKKVTTATRTTRVCEQHLLDGRHRGPSSLVPVRIPLTF